MITAHGHCGAVEVSLPRRPRSITHCNCSICRRYGVLWAYYKEEAVTVTAAPKATQSYIWGRRLQRFVRCKTCGCVVHWQRLESVPNGRMGVNARLFDPEQLGPVTIRQFDGAAWAID